MKTSLGNCQGKHLVFYDGECGFCDHTVQFLLKNDKKKIFCFAPLQGKTAAKIMPTLPAAAKNADSLILLENFGQPNQKNFLFGKAIFRIFWLLGGKWRLLGAPFFLPGFLYNWGYRLVARNRKYLFNSCSIHSKTRTQDRFLP